MEMPTAVMGLPGSQHCLRVIAGLATTISGSRVLLGGGWPEMVMAKGMDKLARKTSEKKSLAIEASLAFLAIPTSTANPTGLDNVELISQLQAAHQEEGCTLGIDVIYGFILKYEAQLYLQRPFVMKPGL